MMVEASLLVLLNLATIGLLPRLFFRGDGRLNPAWWLTAAPFFVAGACHVAFLVGGLDAWAPSPWSGAARAAAIPVAAASIGLIWYTVGSHRIPLALWHQQGDAPREVVTWGPYRWMRHPFYAAFLLALKAALLAGPHLVTAGALVYSAVALTLTARGEERRLAGSALGAEYQAYAIRTGRFVPRLGRLRSA